MWSEQARRAALEARRRKAKGVTAKQRKANSRLHGASDPNDYDYHGPNSARGVIWGGKTLAATTNAQIDKHLTQMERRARTERGQMKAFSLRVALNNPKFATPKAHRALARIRQSLKGK